MIKVVTAIPRLGYDLAADLEHRGFTNVSVTSTDEVHSFALIHGRGIPAAEIARLLDALKPIQPDHIERADDLGPDEIRLLLGDEEPLDYWEVRIHTDSTGLLEQCRDLLEGLGFRDLGHELGVQEKNALVYGGASPFARQVIRWQLRRAGLKIEESRQEEWDDDDNDILLTLSDPALASVPALQRFGVEIVTDDAAAGTVLRDRLQAAGFRCLPLALLSKDQARDAHLTLDPGPFGDDSTSGELARLRVFVSDLLAEQEIDQTRYSLKVGGENKGLSAVITLPLAACRSGHKRPYDGPYPERFRVTIHTDAPEVVRPLQSEFRSAGFPEPAIQQVSSLLDEPADERGPEKGFFVVWGAASKQPEVAQQVVEIVQSHMEQNGSARTFSLCQVERFSSDDPDIWIYYPVRGVDDGRLLNKLSDPARFRIKLYSPEPGEWTDLVDLIERRGFANCEAVSRAGAKPSIDYGAAPSRLIEELRELVRQRSGVNLPPRKIWNDADEDIWFYLPNRPRRSETEPVGQAEGLDLHRWLQPLHPEQRSFLTVTADRLQVGAVPLSRRLGPADPFVPDLGSFRHFCLDALTAETLQHVAASAALREPCLLEGETSTSKTSSILYLAALLKQPVVRLNLNGQTDTGELIGRFVPSSEDDKVTRWQGDKVTKTPDGVTLSPCHPVTLSPSFWRWQDGLVVQAMKFGWWVLLDEVNLAEPQILERLNSVLEAEPSLVLTEHDNSALGPGGQPVHPDFRIFATMNPAEYVGRSVLSPAYRDRWRGYRFVPRPGEHEYLAMLRFLVFGCQPEVTVLGQGYAASTPPDAPPHAALAGWPCIAELLPALARFHAALERAAGQSEDEAGRLGARRKERYVFTRRGLLSVLQYLTSPLGPGSEQLSPRSIREALVRYYLSRISARDDQALVVQLLDAAGIGPNTWSISG
jgi:MoxR-like ATPase